MKNRKNILVLALVLVSLACARTGAPVSPAPMATETPISDSPAASLPPAVGVALASATATPGPGCAIVTAFEALTVRDSASIEGAPVAWLLAGDLVHLAGEPAGEWWSVMVDGRAGFVRSAYLRREECVK